jgi:hypothetical protein
MRIHVLATFTEEMKNLEMQSGEITTWKKYLSLLVSLSFAIGFLILELVQANMLLLAG